MRNYGISVISARHWYALTPSLDTCLIVYQGRWEDELLEVAKQNTSLDVYVVNIGLVTDSAIMRAMLGKGKAITRKETGIAFIMLATEGNHEKEVKNARLVDLSA